MTLAAIGGLVAGHRFHHPEVDGFAGVVVSAWLLYLGYTHAREAIVPLLGQAPSRDMIKRIREAAKSVEVEGSFRWRSERRLLQLLCHTEVRILMD